MKLGFINVFLFFSFLLFLVMYGLSVNVGLYTLWLEKLNPLELDLQMILRH